MYRREDYELSECKNAIKCKRDVETVRYNSRYHYFGISIFRWQHKYTKLFVSQDKQRKLHGQCGLRFFTQPIRPSTCDVPSCKLKSRQSRNLARSVVDRHLHIQGAARIAQILRGQHGALLADQQRGGVGVAADVVRADTQVRDLQALDAVHVEALVQHAVLDDRVALLGRHAARAQRVPGRLHVALDPLLDVLEVLGAVLQVFAHALLVAVEHVGLWGFAGIDGHGPGACMRVRMLLWWFVWGNGNEVGKKILPCWIPAVMWLGPA